MTQPPVPRTLLAAGALFVLAVAWLVGMTLRRPTLPVYPPTPLAPRPAGAQLVGPVLVTIDATDPRRWRFFSFAGGTVLERPAPRDWDLAVRRFQVMLNGGAGFAGDAAARDLGDVAFDDVRLLPVDGYQAGAARGDSVHPVLRRWYRYSYMSHLLRPKANVYAVRTADGRYAKLQFIGYYCPGAMPGCVTFRYIYQGAGGPHLLPVPAAR
jgi:hypothetical protein